MSRRHLLAPIEMECRPALSGHTLWMGSLAAKAADCKSVTRKHRRFVLRFTSVGAEQTSTGRFAPCPIHFSFACPSGRRCHPAKMAFGNAPKVRILPQTLKN